MTVLVPVRDPLPFEASPAPSRGMLAHSDHGVSTCMRCNWRGVPTFVLNTDTGRPEPSHECPVCDRQEPLLGSAKVGRNEPCPCGSQKKAKRCCYR